MHREMIKFLSLEQARRLYKKKDAIQIKRARDVEGGVPGIGVSS